MADGENEDGDERNTGRMELKNAPGRRKVFDIIVAAFLSLIYEYVYDSEGLYHNLGAYCAEFGDMSDVAW